MKNIRTTGIGWILTLTLIVGLVPVTRGSVVSYWTFEGTEEGVWLEDKVGNNDLSVASGTAEQIALPATGAGSAFPDPIPNTGESNTYGADLSAGYLATSTTTSFNRDSFTLEGFFNASSLTSDPQLFYIRQSGSQNQFILDVFDDELRATIYDPDDGSFITGKGRILSGLSVATNTDYYFAVAVSTSETQEDRFADFWLQDLTAEGSLQHERVTLPEEMSALYKNDSLFARLGAGEGLTADNFRYSDGALSESQLMIIPEPHTLGLILLGLAGVVVRRSRRI